MATKEEKAQIVALIDEAGTPSDNYSTGFVNALLLVQGIVEDKDEVFQHDVSESNSDGNSIYYAITQLKNGKEVRRDSWETGKTLQMVRGRLMCNCPIRGREVHDGLFPIDDVIANDWS